MGTRGGVSSNKVKECDFGLGLRMQPKDSCILMSHQSEPSQLSSSSCCSSSSSSLSGGGDGGRPMFYSRSNRDACFGDIYDVVGAGSASENKSLQVSSFTSNSSGEISQPVNMGVPFTVAQWQELERQNMICRYLGASVPVPPELLVPILRTQSNTSNVGKGSLELGISGCNSDPEPWRCKRTDGKKWRCSRDVAPDQKYCERHSHKSRPRSRKPVELHSESMASYTSNYTNVLNQKSRFRSQPNSNFSLFSSSSMVSLPSFYDQQPRSLDWFLKGETVPATSSNSNSSQEWHPMKTESTKCDEKMHPFRGQLESNSYMDLRGGGQTLQTHRLNDNCSLLLSPKAASLTPSSCSQTQAQETRHFLDVWSSAMRDSGNVCGIGNECSVPSSEKTMSLPSSLSLSMAGVCEEIENGEASSFGIIGGSDKEGGCVMRPPSQWMSHGSWLGSTPGGPLAEALCLGISSSAKDGSSHGNTSGIDNKS